MTALFRLSLLPYFPLLGSHFSFKSFPALFSTPQPHILPALARRIKGVWPRVLHGAWPRLSPPMQNWGWAPLSWAGVDIWTSQPPPLAVAALPHVFGSSQHRASLLWSKLGAEPLSCWTVPASFCLPNPPPPSLCAGSKAPSPPSTQKSLVLAGFPSPVHEQTFSCLYFPRVC